MKKAILLIHNRYLQRGGEDNVVEQEIDTLSRNGYSISTLFFYNEGYQKKFLSLFTAPLKLFFNISSFLTVYKRVKKEKIDIVHVHNIYYTASPSVFWAAKLAGAKTVYTLHNYRLFCLNGLFFYGDGTCMECLDKQDFSYGVQRKCFKGSGLYSSTLAKSTLLHRSLKTWKQKVDCFITINSLMHESLLRIGIPPEKIRTTSNYIPSSSANTSEPLMNRQSFYLYAGRMSEEKGIRHLIEVFVGNKKELRLVGDGPLADWVRTQANEFISYHPAIARTELMNWYAQCKALLFPSIWPEGQPMTIIEAQSTGAIIIAGRSAAIDQMITDGVNGFIYESGNPKSLAATILRFEQLEPAQLYDMSLAAKQSFQKKHTEAKHLEAIEEIYDSL